MRRILFCLFLSASATITAHSQLNIVGATFFIGANAVVTVQGDVTSNMDIIGTGILQLKGSSLQNVDMGGNTIPNLELDNAANATLFNTNTRIGTNLLFTNGKLQTGSRNLILSFAATVTNPGASKFVWTNGTGQLIKELTGNISSYELPVGENANYRPAYLTTSGSTYAGGANFGVRVLGTADPNKPPSTAAHLNTAWPVTRTGITGGTTTLAGQYIDPTDVNGTEGNIFGYYYNNATTDWSSSGESHNTGTNRVSVPVTSAAGTVSGINKFVLLGSKAFLQGAYDPVSGLMRDDLRTLAGFGTPTNTANFPSTDPYVVAPYNASFLHSNNPVSEVIPNSGIVGAVATVSDRIVDWVFLELRNTTATPNNDIVQTRSALIQRDGDIVDVDGVSPVTFNNVADGNYILAVRHRNHLGLAFNEANPRFIAEPKSAATTDPLRVFDLRTAPGAQLFGTSAAYTTATHPILGSANLLWGGNANSNSHVRYTGGANDKDFLLITTLGNNQFNFFSNIYSPADVNMNKAIRYTGGANDKDFILITVLGNNQFNFRNQALPN